jgi:O-antigen/teichoic acid export membrane protein
VKLAHAFLLNLFSREATLLASFANAAIIGRTLGPSGLGSYFLVVAISNLLAQGFSLGLNYSNAIMVARSPQQAGSLFTLSAAPLVLYVPIALAAWLAGPQASSWLVADMPEPHRAFLLIGTGIIVYTSNVGGVVFGQERYREYNLVLMVPSIGVCLTNIALFLLGAMSVERVLLAWTAWGLVGAMLMTGILATRSRPVFRIEKGLFRQLLAMGGRALVCAILGFTTTRAMHILLNRHQGTGAVGQYGAMVAFSDLLAHAPGILSWILINRASAETVSPAQVARLLRFHSVVSLAGALVLAALAPFVLKRVFGEGFSKTPVVLWILLAGSYSVGFWSISSGYFTGKQGYPAISIALVALSTGLTLGLGVLLIPKLELVGAAVSWSSASLVVAALSVGVFFAQCRADVRWRDILPRKDDLLTVRAALSGLRSSGSSGIPGKGL